MIMHMKILFLNAWNAQLHDDLAAYITSEARDTDIFCFQEAYDDMKSLCDALLTDFTRYADYKYVTEDDNFPQVTYVRKGISVVSSGSILQDKSQTGLGLYVETEVRGKHFFICNFHGMSRPVDKLDDPNRISQSKALIESFVGKRQVIIGGDFNLFPDTESIQMFEKQGYRDLIKEYKVKTTRNQIAWDMYPGHEQYYSDYVFISSDIRLERFEVIDNKVSDHLPLIVVIDAA